MLKKAKQQYSTFFSSKFQYTVMSKIGIGTRDIENYDTYDDDEKDQTM